MTGNPTPLAEILAAEIRTAGPMRFDAFMARALFDPSHGYYASGRARIGQGGDFYTNVSVGRAFGRVIAAQAAEVWERLGRPTPFDFVEQGGNDGRFAADVLAALRTDHPACFEATRYTLVEPFAALADAQRIRLAPCGGTVQWVDTLADLPAFTGVHFTNEYVDALPVRLFVRGDGAWRERFVDVAAAGLTFSDQVSPAPPPELPADAPDGYLAETRPIARTWLEEVAGKLSRGLVLIVDYGYPRDQLYAPWRTAGTLSGYRAHRREDDPLADVGDKDLTAHVDFSSLVATARDAHLTVAGFADQHHFIVGAATSLLLALEAAGPGPERDADLRALKTLLHPEMMGTQFKYLGLTRGLPPSPPLAGFRYAGTTLP